MFNISLFNLVEGSRIVVTGSGLTLDNLTMDLDKNNITFQWLFHSKGTGHISAQISFSITELDRVKAGGEFIVDFIIKRLVQKMESYL